jgi:hypothetical protein
VIWSPAGDGAGSEGLGDALGAGGGGGSSELPLVCLVGEGNGLLAGRFVFEFRFGSSTTMLGSGVKDSIGVGETSAFAFAFVGKVVVTPPVGMPASLPPVAGGEGSTA